MQEKWIVSVDTSYYPYIEEFDNYEDANKYYEEQLSFFKGRPDHSDDHGVYLSKVEKYEKFDSEED